MKVSIASLVLAATSALAASSASRHQRFHQRRAASSAAVESRDSAAVTAIWNNFNSVLAIPMVAEGNENVKPDDSLEFKNTVTNNAGEDLILVAWNNGQFKLTTESPPAMTVYIPDGATTKISMSSAYSGAMTVLNHQTPLAVSGQINNTFLEMTTGGSPGVVDVSREVNMYGHSFTVKQSQCTTSMTECVFTCLNGAVTCGWNTPYQLTNCQGAGANVGESYGAPSGGCNIEKEMTTEIGPPVTS